MLPYFIEMFNLMWVAWHHESRANEEGGFVRSVEGVTGPPLKMPTYYSRLRGIYKQCGSKRRAGRIPKNPRKSTRKGLIAIDRSFSTSNKIACYLTKGGGFIKSVHMFCG